MPLQSDTIATLESMIDSHGLSDVLESIAQICHEKSEHVSQNWQDAILARAWQKAGNAIDSAANSPRVIAVSG